MVNPGKQSKSQPAHNSLYPYPGIILSIQVLKTDKFIALINYEEVGGEIPSLRLKRKSPW